MFCWNNCLNRQKRADDNSRLFLILPHEIEIEKRKILDFQSDFYQSAKACGDPPAQTSEYTHAGGGSPHPKPHHTAVPIFTAQPFCRASQAAPCGCPSLHRASIPPSASCCTIQLFRRISRLHRTAVPVFTERPSRRASRRPRI